MTACADLSVPASGTEKLPKAQVLSMRKLRARTKASGKPADWRELATKFGVHPKTAYRICVGMVRCDVGGPLEPRLLRSRNSGDNIASLPRCGVCRARLVVTPCMKCQGVWQRKVLQVLLDTGLVRIEQKRRGSGLKRLKRSNRLKRKSA